MACGCGGGNGGGGCAGGQEPVLAPVELPTVQEFIPPVCEADNQAASEAPELIASSEQEWPRIKVNGIGLAVENIAQELQYHPADTRQEAVFLASQALVIRELLTQRINALGLKVQPIDGESREEAAISELIKREVVLPSADPKACRQYYENNRERFASAPLLAARHILLACAADDVEGRSLANEQAHTLLAQLQADASLFGELVQAHSACPSKAQGGALGQISQGQTVPEFERQLFRLPEGLAGRPLESRYGFHLVWVDQRIEGKQLPFEVVEGSIRAELDQRVWQVAVVQYIKGLIGAADIQGIVLEGADSPLLQ
ncbi:peptidylprolyl isomerase [Pseudomonas anguilliseptica]|uniref:peptidylprolyl isomerase n=1 Tax=Pseudomonas anguilliseptica TaxID=53406 RepID=UPI0022AF3148|nr:peptidylprolyl isomerase [Pseudomonas anguilliseptica]MCZ4323106.1 peptidylprolyl isomerase [Pseudomonas anguilliseptica]